MQAPNDKQVKPPVAQHPSKDKERKKASVKDPNPGMVVK